MTAQRKFETNVAPSNKDMIDGDHVKCSHPDLLQPHQIHCLAMRHTCFSSGSAPMTTALHAGDGVGMFSSGSAP